MQKASKGAATVALLLVAAAISSPSFAQSVDNEDGPFVSAIPDDALSTIAGREDTAQLSTATQTAGVADNSVGDNVTTGDASIDGNAFQNLSGLSVLNVNTGNNVAINAAMNVNISINPQ